MQLALPYIERGGPVPPYIASAMPQMQSTESGYSSDDGLVDDAKAVFESYGIEVLGDGAYSLVVPHTDADKVVKLTLSEQDGYHAYLDWIAEVGSKLRFPLRQHLPVIHETYVLNGIRVTIMERLESLESRTSDYDDYEELKDLVRSSTPPESRNDMGWSNVMQRADGTPVITDPWAHREGCFGLCEDDETFSDDTDNTTT